MEQQKQFEETSAGTKPAVQVWLVDDNDELRGLIAELLSAHGGIDCARHFSCPDALLSTLASRPGPDVILLDVQMRDRNGLDAVRPIKSLNRSTRVLMFTTANNRDWRQRALEEGASDYLLKTEAMEQVAARIRRAAEEPPTRPARRRAACRTVKSSEIRQAQSAPPRTSRLLSHTLRMLRLISN
jgi:DNA-binding NarL/FixJ family response regulator